MKCASLIAIVLVLCAVARSTYAETAAEDNAIAESTNGVEQLETAASNPLEDTHKQEKRYIGGAWDPYSSRLGLGGIDGTTGYGGYGGYGNYAGYSGLGGLSDYGGYGGYGGYGAYGGYGGYGNYAGSGPYGGYGSPYSYYNARFGNGYPYSRFGYNYPSSYYSGYTNSVVGGGLGGYAGAAGVVPPVGGVGVGAGYQYGPGISGTVY